jgi:uncharacterized protein YndB with AHSA1/START domain
VVRSRELLHYECAIDISASPAEVFAVAGDLTRTPEWEGSGHVQSILKVTDGPVGVGTRYRSSETITMSYRAETEVTAYRPPAAIEWISKPAGERVPYHRWSFSLQTDPTGTRLIHTVHATRAVGLMGLVQRLGFLFTRPQETVPRGMDETVRRIKALAEARTVR